MESLSSDLTFHISQCDTNLSFTLSLSCVSYAYVHPGFDALSESRRERARVVSDFLHTQFSLSSFPFTITLCLLYPVIGYTVGMKLRLSLIHI